ncbi:MAG: ABC transporter ATP-binding protein [Polyangiaceae bacterium]|nr:ABC transporter ATP-binding protein [Polyangiaceae bacterium]
MTVSLAWNALGSSFIDAPMGEVEAGDRVAVLGPNGAGKSTFLRMLAGLGNPERGTVHISGHPLSTLLPGDLARLRSYVEQEPTLPDDLSVATYVSLGGFTSSKGLGFETESMRASIVGALNRLRVGEKADHLLASLSGGERRLAVVARAFFQDAPLLFLDEPVTFLDLPNEAVLLDALREESEKGRIVVAVMHQIERALEFANKIVFVRSGQVSAPIRVAEVEETRLESVFGIPFSRIMVGEKSHFLRGRAQ